MGSKTISLEDSAYEKLKAAKRPGESFSDVVHRLVAPKPPSLLELRDLFTPEDARKIGETVTEMRQIQEKLQAERWERLKRLWEGSGS